MAIHLPQNYKDGVLFVFFWLGGVFTLVYELYFVVWWYHKEWNFTVYCLYAAAIYLAIVICFSQYKIIGTDIFLTSSLRSNYLTGGHVGPTGWKYCDKCPGWAPARSHHCKLCNICILKRDHHCLFSGYCIGYQNHRYFFCLILHASVAGVWANVYNWPFVLDLKGGFAWTTLPSFFAPQIGLVLGKCTALEFLITVITSVGLMFTLFFLTLLVSQTIQAYHGQVQYERKKGVYDYSCGLKSNIKEIFGSAGIWGLFCPFIVSSLPSDGTKFSTNNTKSE